MKVTIEYDGHEEREELRTALDGYKWKYVVRDIDEELRQITKYGQFGNKEATSEERESAEKIREELRRLLNEWNLNLDE
jgi:hypothetical protein